MAASSFIRQKAEEERRRKNTIQIRQVILPKAAELEPEEDLSEEAKKRLAKSEAFRSGELKYGSADLTPTKKSTSLHDRPSASTIEERTATERPVNTSALKYLRDSAKTGVANAFADFETAANRRQRVASDKLADELINTPVKKSAEREALDAVKQLQTDRTRQALFGDKVAAEMNLLDKAMADVAKNERKQELEDFLQKYNAPEQKARDTYNRMNAKLYEEGKNQSKAVQQAGNIARSIGYMAPSMAIGGAYGAANTIGTAAMGAQAMGGGYEEARSEGADAESALRYAIGKGLLAFGTEKITGAIPGLGKGGLDDAIDTLTGKLSNEWARYLARRGIDRVGESLEEVAEEFLTPYLKRATYDQNAETASGRDLLGAAASGFAVSSILGTAGDIAGIQTARQEGRARRTGSEIQEMGDDTLSAVINEGLSSGRETDSYRRASELQGKRDRGELLTAQEIGELHYANQNAIAEENAMARRDRQDRIRYSAKQAEADTNPTMEAQSKRLSFALGQDIELYDKAPTAEGTENGYYRDGKIYINVRSKDPLTKIFAHELTHSTEESDLYGELAKHVRGQIPEFDTEAKNLKAGYAANGVNLSDREAGDEVVANYVSEKLLTDEQEIYKVALGSPKMAERIQSSLDGIMARMGNQAAGARQKVQQIRNIYSAAIQEATAIAGPVTMDAQIQANIEADGAEFVDGATSKFSYSTWTEKEAAKVAQNLIAAGYDEEKVDNWIKDINSIAADIGKDLDRLDYTAADNQRFMKKNAEYKYTLDASTLCAKRILFQGIFNEIQHLMPNTVLMSDDILDLVNLMKKRKLDAPCGVCYVESRRRHLGNYAQKWLDGYSGEYVPRLDEVTTTDGLEALRHEHPQTYKDFVDAMKKIGVNNPKVVELRTAYQGDVRRLAPTTVKKLNDAGGLRVQSFSDFETAHLLDMMQAVADMASKGLKSQAYTKVPDFAWVFGDTGMKINLSLIADGFGLDANGNLVFSSVEGMDINEAVALRKAYPQNVGTICVGVNDAHILKLMQDDRIDFIIPFHKSGWGANELAKMNMQAYKDYTAQQNERNAKTGKNVRKNLQPSQYWKDYRSGVENAEAYLKMCAEMGRIPKFAEFLHDNGDGSYSLQPDGSTDGYWKLLIDFKMYDNDGAAAPQQVVTPEFNMTHARRILENYSGYADKLPVNYKIVDEFVNEYKAKHQKTQYSITPEKSNVLPTAEDLATREIAENEQIDILNDNVNAEVDNINAEVDNINAEVDNINAEVDQAARQEEYMEELKEQAGKFGRMKPGEKPVREVMFPNTAEKGKKNPLTARTILEAAITPDASETTNAILAEIAAGNAMYTPHSNKTTDRSAHAWVRNRGFSDALESWRADVNSGKTGDNLVARGAVLLNNAMNAGDSKKALDIFTDYVDLLTTAGQAVQAARILKQLSPSAKLYTAQRAVNKLNRESKKANKNSRKVEQGGDVIYDATEDALNSAAEAYTDAAENYNGTRYGGAAYASEPNYNGTPFAFEYIDKIGTLVGEYVERSVQAGTRETAVITEIVNQLNAFARETLPKRGKAPQTTAIDRIRDFLANQDAYNEAWGKAQEYIRDRFKNDEAMLDALESFTGTPIGFMGNPEDNNKIMLSALAQAAFNKNETKQRIRTQKALHVTNVSEVIADELIKQTGATGESADIIRNAAYTYVNRQMIADGKNDEQIVNAKIKSVMREIGTTLSQIASSSAGTKTNIKDEIVNRIVSTYATDKQTANYVAEVVEQHFTSLIAEQAHKKLTSIFGERKVGTPKTLAEKFLEYGNLGTFNSDEFAAKASQKLFGVPDYVIPTELAEKFLAAENDEARDAVMDEIYSDIAAQMPTTLEEYFTALRYTAMLGNLKTQVRNVTGNVGMQTQRILKDRLAAVMELTMDKSSRTKSFVGDPKLYKLAAKDFAQFKDAAMGEQKYTDTRGVMKEVAKRRDPFYITQSWDKADGLRKAINVGSKALSAWRKVTNWAMENGDVVFSKFTYADSLAGYLKARGVTAKQFEAGTVDESLLDEARAYAISEAQKATFRDNNQVSEAVSSIGFRTEDTTAKKLINATLKGVLPFRKTPANVMVRAVEYSPLGLVKAAAQTVEKLRGEAVSGSEIADTLAQALTGTGLFVLGVMLSQSGMLRGREDDDEKQAAFDELVGHQTYAIELPNGQSFTIDWATPASIPLFMGAELAQNGLENGFQLKDVLDVATSVTAPLMDMSMMSGLSDVFENVSYSEDPLRDAVINALTSYMTQGLSPTILGQIERTAEDERMTTFVDKDSQIPDDMQYFLGKVSSKIPGWDYQQIPYIDAWGETEESAGAAEQFLSPAYTSAVDMSAMEEKLQELYDRTGESSVLPTRTKNYITVSGEKINLSADQYVEFATTRGQYQKTELEKLTASSGWQKMNDTERIKAVREIYDDANLEAKKAVFGAETALQSYNKDVYESAKKLNEQGVSFEDYYDLYFAMKEADAQYDGYEASNAKRNIIMKANLSDSEKKALYNEKISDTRDDDIQAFREAGLSFTKFLQAQNKYAEINAQEGSAAEHALSLARWVEQQNFTEDQEVVIKDTFKYYSQIPANTDKYDAMIGLDMDDDAAAEVLGAVSNLEPLEGKTAVSDNQKYQAILDTNLTYYEKAKAFEVYMPESTYSKLEEAMDYNIDMEDYITYMIDTADIKGDKDANGNTISGSKKAKILDYIDGMSIGNEQKDALYIMAGYSEKTLNDAPWRNRVSRGSVFGSRGGISVFSSRSR